MKSLQESIQDNRSSADWLLSVIAKGFETAFMDDSSTPIERAVEISTFDGRAKVYEDTVAKIQHLAAQMEIANAEVTLGDYLGSDAHPLGS